MKIKKLPNNSQVILEFEEFYSKDDPERIQLIDSISKDYNGVRKAYNMWQFENYSTAEKFVFMYRLKYENSSKENR